MFNGIKVDRETDKQRDRGRQRDRTDALRLEDEVLCSRIGTFEENCTVKFQ